MLIFLYIISVICWFYVFQKPIIDKYSKEGNKYGSVDFLIILCFSLFWPITLMSLIFVHIGLSDEGDKEDGEISDKE